MARKINRYARTVRITAAKLTKLEHKKRSLYSSSYKKNSYKNHKNEPG